jgi:hypothetical protein
MRFNEIFHKMNDIDSMNKIEQCILVYKAGRVTT